MKITMVKKVFPDGSPCKKCGEVEEKMRAAGQLQRIDRVVIADEANDQSEGMLLAAEHNIDRAPFFIVERDGQQTEIYTVYFKFVKEVLDSETSEEEEIAEIMNDNDLDFL
jgi:tRNA(Ile)-lysidine synthase TilS/MesJ